MSATARFLVRSASVVVPRRRRAEWLEEWESELLHARDDALAAGESAALISVRLTLRSLAAWTDALAVRRTSGSADGVLWHLRQATRMLRREPAFCLRVILTLALGMGSATALFSVVDGLLLTPVPFPAGDRLVRVYHAETGSLRMDEVDVWTSDRSVFEAAYAYSEGSRVLTMPGAEPRDVRTTLIEPALLGALNIVPALGRGFHPEEAAAGRASAVLLSHALWRDSFGGDSTVLGRTVALDGLEHTVIGILPERVRRLPNGPTDVVLPLSASYGQSVAGMMAWLRPDLTEQQAESRLDAIAARLDRERPQERSWPVFLMPVTDDLGVTGERALLALAAAALLLMLIACVNAAGLLFVRGLTRGPELAIRAAIGASRGALFRQVLSESLLLALIAGGLGVLLAWWGVRVLLALVPGEFLQWSYAPVHIDGRVLLFSLLLTLVTGCLFGAGPALRATRAHVTHGWRRSTASPAELRARRGVQVVQLALAMLLVSGAALFARSYLHLINAPPGFDVSGLLLLELQPTRMRADSAARAAFQHDLDARLRSLPGVSAVSWSTGGVPPNAVFHFVPDGLTLEDGTTRMPVDTRFLAHATVDVNYFRTMRVRLNQGRSFLEEDVGSGENPVIIDPDLASLLWPGQPAVGRRFRPGENRPWLTVIGVSADLRLTGPEERMGPYALLYPGRLGTFRRMQIAIRTSGDAAAIGPAVRAAVHAVDPNQPIAALMPVRDVLAISLAQPRFIFILTVTFATLALVLAIMGIYALIEFAVAQRTQEIGVRLALGAASGSLARAVMLSGLSLVASGILLGLVLTAALARFIDVLLFGIPVLDPLALGATALLLTACSALALIPPAWRAAHIDANTALRAE